MLIKKSNRDKNCILHTDHDYSSNHLWISLLIIKYRDLSSDTFSNFTKKERSDSDIPYLAILLHILYQFWSFANQILKIADLLRSYLNTHNCVIKSESKLQIPLLDYPLFHQFIIFSSNDGVYH